MTFWRYLKIYFKVTYLLIGINVMFFVLTSILAIFLGGNSQAYGQSLVLLGAEYFPAIIQGQVWRMILSSFLHAGIIHLAINMLALWNIGIVVENFYGGRKLFLVYVFTGITGSLFSVIATFFGFNMIDSPSVGASAAIFGLVGLFLGNRYRKNTYAPDIPINTGQLWLFVFYNLLFGLGFNVFGNVFGGGILINNYAHIGGLVGGIFFGFFLDTINTFYMKSSKKIFENLLFFGSVFLTILSFFANIVAKFFGQI